MRQVGLCLLAAAALHGGEYAIFANGFRMQTDRHESAGEMVKLYTGTGVIEMPASAIAGFEKEDYDPPAAPGAVLPQNPPRAEDPPHNNDTRKLVDEAADRYGIPREFLHSVARVESAYQANAVSPKGAAGVMQLMPATARQLEADPHNTVQNIDAGARHLRDLLLQYQGQTMKALAAYNAGAGAVRKHNGVPPYRETRNYVEKVLNNYWRLVGSNQTADQHR